MDMVINVVGYVGYPYGNEKQVVLSSDYKFHNTKSKCQLSIYKIQWIDVRIMLISMKCGFAPLFNMLTMK